MLRIELVNMRYTKKYKMKRVICYSLFLLLICSTCGNKVKEKELPTQNKAPKLIKPLTPENRNKSIALFLKKIERENDELVDYYYEGLKNGGSGWHSILQICGDMDFLSFFIEGGGLEVLSGGIEPITKVYDYTPYSFNHINPKFVEWFAQNMIPRAGERIGDQTAQAIYSEIGYPFCRQLMASHDYLEKVGFDQAVDDYKAKTKEMNEEDIVQYFFKTYSVPTSQEPIPNIYMAGAYFDGGVACSFWIRRRMDGSEAAIWKMLQNVMEEYDAGFEEYRTDYKYIYPTS